MASGHTNSIVGGSREEEKEDEVLITCEENGGEEEEEELPTTGIDDEVEEEVEDGEEEETSPLICVASPASEVKSDATLPQSLARRRPFSFVDDVASNKLVDTDMEDLQRSSTALYAGGVAKKLPQYLAALSATLGACALGAVLGYSSPASPQLKDNTTDVSNLHITEEEDVWFSSSMNLGALVGGPVGGFLINSIGRRGTMLASVIPFLGGWLLIAFAQNFAMLLTGRLITGLCCGVTSLTVPTYIGEYASADVRGTLGSAFQLMVTVGILYVYGIGAIIKNWPWLAIASGILLIVYVVAMFFAKESPIFLLSKGKEEEASKALQYFRGKDYNIELEMQTMRESLENAKQNKAGFMDLMRPYILKPLVISLMLMIFQQFSGVNAVLFNLTTIFQDAGTSISEDLSTIMIALMQVIATALSVILMDKAGRKLLLLVSSGFMCISLIGMGVFFYEKSIDEEKAETLGWLPLLSLIVFIAAFSIGFGPIPWLMMGELFSPNVKELAASIATSLNWTMSFVVTRAFSPMQEAMQPFGIYFFFSAICGVAFIFCLLMVPETKGKTLDEITAHFGGLPDSRRQK